MCVLSERTKTLIPLFASKRTVNAFWNDIFEQLFRDAIFQNSFTRALGNVRT